MFTSECCLLLYKDALHIRNELIDSDVFLLVTRVH